MSLKDFEHTGYLLILVWDLSSQILLFLPHGLSSTNNLVSNSIIFPSLRLVTITTRADSTVHTYPMLATDRMAFPLLKLPRELRDKVYEQYFEDLPVQFPKHNPRNVDDITNTLSSSDSLSILSTCRQIYEEASDFFYNKHPFGFRFRGSIWAEGMGKNVTRIRHLHILCDFSEADTTSYHSLAAWSFTATLCHFMTQGCCFKVLTLVLTPQTVLESSCTEESSCIDYFAWILDRLEVTDGIVFIVDGLLEGSISHHRSLATEVAECREWKMSEVPGYAFVLQPEQSTSDLTRKSVKF